MTRIIVVGPLKSSYIKDGVRQYLKWIKKFERIELIQLPLSGDLNKTPPSIYKDKDFKKFEKYFPDSFNVLLDERGEQMDSIKFSQFYEHIKSSSGAKFINFIVGGPLGHSDEIYNKADSIISLSKLTFTHELAVLILLEQLFRVNKILHNETYHY
ncbi:23S rRNA (pseudouridine(1915)-N(3))-methyltransferase RlmH [Petrotoga olearia]|uniref:Ribosomal RNA large subunit methyltransferase H n=2 Tax=Petrotoga olearia TaxID=156203 RepID=A0A2K1P2D7_9BACT|nr:23S rRNA (pseudouridine(1915)-N(3))-methyltransferase RlmH [Petrotoga olearia]KUK15798.1 MAG: Ribosomal RNA large subunit methyltransferase H [Petrotoga mobilis]PNR96920.1 50S rRNA methyltransferase [Petrotoga olearia DSM 13574]RMA70572.1 23S rRNA (pseudouridine1915-N3)-methyltransferase [Petrotoga olearia]